jgi:anti-sigma-K factor RskA
MSGDVHNLSAPYALDSLDVHDAEAFEKHLANCETCATDVREMRETAAVLAVSAAIQPPSSLRDTVLAQVQVTGQLPVDGSSVTPLKGRRRLGPAANRWFAGVAAAAVVVAAGLGVVAYQADQRADDARVVAEQVAEILADPEATLERADVAGGGSGALVTSPDSEQVVFLTRGLPAADVDQTYQLWAIDEAGATSVGLLQPDDGRASELIDLPSGTTTFGMTVEPAGGSEQPTTEPVLLLDVTDT